MSDASSFGLLSSNGSDVKVNNMERFKSDNEELKKWVEKVTDNVSTILKGTVSANITLKETDANLNNLKTVTLSSKWKITYYDTSLEKSALSLLQNTTNAISRCYSGFKYAQLLIEAYNNGGELPPELEQEKNEWGELIKRFMVDPGPWIFHNASKWARDLLDKACPSLAGLVYFSGLVTYGKDGVDDGGDFIFGDITCKGIDALFDWAGSKLSKDLTKPKLRKLFASKLFEGASKVGFGSAVVLAWELFFGYRIRKGLDEDDYTDVDDLRNKLTVGKNVMAFASWTAISELCMAAGMTAGPAGIVATISSIPIGIFLDAIVDRISGDEVVSQFDINDDGKIVNGKKYSVPRNGTGENGNYKAILRGMNKYRLNHVTGDYENVYYDWYNYGNYYNGESMNLTRDDITIFNDALDCVKKASSEEEAAQIWSKITHYEMSVNDAYSDDVQNESIRRVEACLNTLDRNDTEHSFEFDIREWWKINKK